MSEITDYPFTVEQLREQQEKFNNRHNTQLKITELPKEYADKLRATDPQSGATISISEDVILARALKAIARPQKELEQVMSYEIAKRIVWEIGKAILATCNKTWKIEDENKAIVENLVKYFINDPSGKYDVQKGIYLFGDVGRGKTFLFNVMKTFADAVPITSKRFKIAHCGDIVDRVLWTKDSTGEHMRDYQNGGWLFDDLGNEPGAVKSFGNDIQVMERLLVQRYAKFVNGLCITHVTSNDTPEELAAKYGTRLADRSKEMFNFVYLKGESKRK